MIFLVLDHLEILVGQRNKEAFAGEESPGSTEYSENIRRARYTLSVYENMYLLYVDRLTVKF